MKRTQFQKKETNINDTLSGWDYKGFRAQYDILLDFSQKNASNTLQYQPLNLPFSNSCKTNTLENEINIKVTTTFPLTKPNRVTRAELQVGGESLSHSSGP